MDCIDLKDPVVMMNAFALTSDGEKRKVYNCFRELFGKYCELFAHKHIFLRYSFMPENVQEVLSDTFTDAFVAFQQYVIKHGYKESAKVETAFLSFYKRLIWPNIRSGNPDKRRYPGDPGDILENTSDNFEYDHNSTITSERNYEFFEKGFALLSERCQQLIIWRKYKRLSDAEIAGLLQIKDGTVNNEVYRCWNKLKSLVNGFMKLDNTCQNLLAWVKIKKLGIDEVANLSGLPGNSVNKEAEKCEEKLNNIINGK